MRAREMNLKKNPSFSYPIRWWNKDVRFARPKKPGEIIPPDKNPEIIPPQPSPVTWPKKEPEIQPEREPLTNPPTSPPEIPKPPESDSGTLHFLNWESQHPPLNSGKSP